MKKYNKIILSVIMTIVMVCTVIVPISVSAASQKGVVTGITSYLNVRSSPGTGYSIIGKLYNNETVTVVGSATGDGIDWFKIEFDDGYGYVSAEFIKLIEDDTNFENYLTEQGFPESYKDGLRTIHEQHPEWIFVAQHIGPDWATVIRNESKVGVNLVPASSPAEQKSFEEDAFDFEKNTWKGLDGSWVAASEQIVSWAIDPRNFLDDSYIFQFEKLSYVSDHTLSGINGILSGTFMAGEYPDDEFSSFAEAIMQAAKQSQVSAYHLASRLKQEQGSKGNPLAHGTVEGYKDYYNYFNVGAYDTDTNGMYVNGAIYAKNKGWNTPYKAILGGAELLAKQYIAKEQDTLYLQKFDVTDGGNGYYNHQYMTNVFAPSSESLKMVSAYSDDLINSPLVFYIPVYKNMPATACPKPTSSRNNNNLLDSLSVSGYPISPSFYRYTTEYSATVEATAPTTVTISAQTSNTTYATVSGTGEFDLKEGLNTATLIVTAPSGVKRTYTLKITLKIVEEDQPVLNPEIKTEYMIGKYITGVAPNTTLADFAEKFSVSNGSFKIFGISGYEVSDDNLSTAHTLRIYNTRGVETASYQIAVIGDNNGDGLITSVDLLRMQRQMLSTMEFKGVYLKACDVNLDGVIDVADLIYEQSYILGLA